MPGTRKKWPQPPLDASTAFAEWAFHVRDLINSLFGQAGMALIAYVDKGGDDGSAVIGSLVNTFLTVQGAIDALETAGYGESAVVVGPGTYTEDITWPNLNNLWLVGSGRDVTYLQNLTATHTVAIAPPAAGNAMHQGGIRDLSISNTVNNPVVYALSADGILTDDAFDEGGLAVWDCDVYKAGVAADNAAAFRRLNFLDVRGCNFGPRLGGNDVFLYEIATAWVESVFGKDLTVSYDTANPVPAQDRGWLAMSNAIWLGGLYGAHIALIACGADVQVNNIGFPSEDVSDGGAGEWHGRLDFHGRVASDVTISALWGVDVGRNNDPAFRFKGAIIGGALTLGVTQSEIGCSTLAGAFYDCTVYGAVNVDTLLTAASAVVAELLHCSFKSTFDLTDDGADAFSGAALCKQSVFTPGNAITCTDADGGNAANPYIDLRSAFFLEADLVTVATGGIDRSMIHGTLQNGGGAQAVGFTADLPAGATAYGVSLDFLNIADAPASVTLKAETGFTITPTGPNADIDWVVLRPAP